MRRMRTHRPRAALSCRVRAMEVCCSSRTQNAVRAPDCRCLSQNDDQRRNGLGLLPGSSGKTLARAGHSRRPRRDEAADGVATAEIASSDPAISNYAPRITTMSLPTYNSQSAGHPAACHTAGRGSTLATKGKGPPARRRRSTQAEPAVRTGARQMEPVHAGIARGRI